MVLVASFVNKKAVASPARPVKAGGNLLTGSEKLQKLLHGVAWIQVVACFSGRKE